MKNNEDLQSFCIERVCFQTSKDILKKYRNESGLSEDGEKHYQKLKEYGCYDCRCIKMKGDGDNVIICQKECIMVE